MNRLSNHTTNELNILGFQKTTESIIDRDSYFSAFFNADITFIIIIVNSPKEVKDTWLVTAFNRGENCSYDLNTIEGISVDEKGRAQFKSEENIVPFIKKLIHKIKKDKGEIIEEDEPEDEQEQNELIDESIPELIEEDNDEDVEEIANNAISEEEYQALTDEERSHFYTKEEIKYIFDNSLYLHEILELYKIYVNSGCKVLSSIITTTNIFKHMYYSLDSSKNPDYSTYPNINEPKKNIYTEEEILNELRKLPENLYLTLFERSIYYHEKLPSKWIDLILKVKKSPEELKEFVNKHPVLIEDSAKDGFEKMIKIFIDAGIDMSQSSALHWAAHNGHAKVVKILLDIGCPINDVIAWVGANSGNTEVVKLAIAAGADYTTGYAGTSIIEAVEDGNVEMVKVLLEAGSDPTIEGYRLFNSAYNKGKKKANINYREIYELLELYNEKRILKKISMDLSDEKEVENHSELKTGAKTKK